MSQDISKEEIAHIIVKSFNIVLPQKITSELNEKLSNFYDQDKLVGNMELLAVIRDDIMPGKDIKEKQNFNPQGAMIRGEAAAVVCKAIDKYIYPNTIFCK